MLAHPVQCQQEEQPWHAAKDGLCLWRARGAWGNDIVVTTTHHHQVCVIGDRSFATHGSHGSDIYLAYRHFPTLEACCTWLRTEQHARIIGVEITDTAEPVQRHPFTTATAFMMGNEGTGLSPKQLALCDSFVYIPQHGRGTASLNVNVAAAIVLHRFASWAQLPEAPRSGFKYELADRPQRRAPRGMVPLTPAEREAERGRRAALAEESEETGSMLGALVGYTWCFEPVLMSFSQRQFLTTSRHTSHLRANRKLCNTHENTDENTLMNGDYYK